MKKILIANSLFLLLINGQLSAQTTPENKGWPSSERISFIRECIKEAQSSMSKDTARFYCYCMQENMERQYPTIEQASMITEDSLLSEAWQKKIKSCLSGFWGTEEREAFLSECIKSTQKNAMDLEKSNSYCECMLFKVESAFPNPLDANKLTPEVLNTPKWKKIIQSCLDN